VHVGVLRQEQQAEQQQQRLWAEAAIVYLFTEQQSAARDAICCKFEADTQGCRYGINYSYVASAACCIKQQDQRLLFPKQPTLRLPTAAASWPHRHVHAKPCRDPNCQVNFLGFCHSNSPAASTS
jgi:hypothetical protein